MENGFKVRISRMFQSSFNSCRTKHNSDVVADHPFFFPENRHHRQLIDLFSPKPQPFSKPKHHVQNHPKPIISRPKISDKNTLFPVTGKPLFYENTSKNAKKKKPHYRKTTKSQDFSSVTDNYYYDCYSSDEDDESDDETNLFSSRSLSSDSSVKSFRKNGTRRKIKKPTAAAGGGGCKDRKATDVIPLKGKGKFVKDSVAVVKKSNDPHEDFRVSMLEMIVERQIFGGEDLENLLKCFLSLNSEEHHGVILEVFSEIWETLFSEWL